MKVSVVGLGYVGSTMMGCISEKGVEVIGIDVDPQKIYTITKKCLPPINEEGLDELFQRNKRKIKATTDYGTLKDTDISFICVGTPSNEDGSVNLSQVFDATRKIGAVLKSKEEYHLIVLVSTVPPGTSRKVVRILEKESKKKCGVGFGYCMNPEFLREGKAIKDFFNPPFIIIGEYDRKSGDLLEEFYGIMGMRSEDNVYRMSLESAEIFKYINNAFHAVKVAFANEVLRICSQFNVDTQYLMEIFVKDKKLNISPYYLKPGYAFGGSCIPKDVRGLLSFSRVSIPLIEATLKSNQEHIMWSLQKIFSENPKRVCIVGISFKKGTGDIRESQYVALMKLLIDSGIEVCYYDPLVDLATVKSNRKSLTSPKLLLNLNSLRAETPEEVYRKNVDLLIIGSGNGIEDLDMTKFAKIIDLQGTYRSKYKHLKNYESLV